MEELIYIIDERSIRRIKLVFRLIVCVALALALWNAFRSCWHYSPFNAELPVYLLFAVIMAAVMNDICKMTTDRKNVIIRAMILAFVYVLVVFLLNNIWRYCSWKFLFGSEYIFRVFVDDLKYSYNFGWARYPALFLCAMAGLLAEHSALRWIKNTILKYRYRKTRKNEFFTDL